MRVTTVGLPKDNWHHFLRLRDLRQIVDEMPMTGVSRVLELGAGDGVQTAALRELFSEVIPLDIAPSGQVPGMVIADASHLPFVDGYFDLVFSSNVLEHVYELEESLTEMKRVLAPNGIMIHSMPTSTWKFVQVAVRPVASMIKVLRKIRTDFIQRNERSTIVANVLDSSATPPIKSWGSKIVGQLIPTIHGTSNNHIEEFFHFRTRWWMKKFGEAELRCYRLSPLFFHSPYSMLPYKFLYLRERFAVAGLASVRVFWLRSSEPLVEGGGDFCD
jgi:SAM-dependent methyltransferase